MGFLVPFAPNPSRALSGRAPPCARVPQGIVLTHSALGWILTAFQAVLPTRVQETEMRPDVRRRISPRFALVPSASSRRRLRFHARSSGRRNVHPQLPSQHPERLLPFGESKKDGPKIRPAFAGRAFLRPEGRAPVALTGELRPGAWPFP